MKDEKQQGDFDTSLTDEMFDPDLESPEPEESTDTETETVEADTETETVTEESEETATEGPEETADDEPAEQAPVVDEAAILARYGLGGQYNSLGDALDAIKHKEARIQQMEYDRYMESRRMAEASAQPQRRQEPLQIDPEALMTDPNEVLAKAGFVRQEDVVRLARETAMGVNDERAYSEFVKNTPDFDVMKPAMMAKLRQYPALQAVPMADAAQVLYAMCKQEQTPKPPPTVLTQPSTPGKKERATTSGGKPAGGTKSRTQVPLGPGGIPIDKFNKMSVDEIDKHPEFFEDPND